MNQGYYTNYLKNSSYYRNLSNAKNSISDVIGKINGLISVLNNASGTGIDNLKKGLDDLYDELSSYNNQIDSIQDSLEKNAEDFDKILNNYKKNIGNIYKTELVWVPEASNSTLVNHIIDDVFVDKNSGYINLKLRAIPSSSDESKAAKILREKGAMYSVKVIKFY